MIRALKLSIFAPTLGHSTGSLLYIRTWILFIIREFDLRILLIAIAGAIGAVSRYGLSSFISNQFGEKFALGTLAVNVIGCFLIGFVMHLALSTDIISEQTRIAVTVGFLGALTTFSTFGYETLKYIDDRAWLMAASNVVLNVACGLLATILGLIIAKALVGGS